MRLQYMEVCNTLKQSLEIDPLKDPVNENQLHKDIKKCEKGKKTKWKIKIINFLSFPGT